MRLHYFFLAVLSLCLTTVPGCKKTEIKKQVSQFELAIDYYGAALRWGRHREAAALHVTKNQETQTINIEALKKIRVTRFKVLDKQIIPAADEHSTSEGSVIAEIEYFHEERGVIRKIMLNQEWWYNREIKRWLIDTEFPQFK